MAKQYTLRFRLNPKDKETRKGFNTLEEAIKEKQQLEDEGYEVICDKHYGNK